MHPPQPPTHLLYLHGFRSSPLSFKARRLAAVVAALKNPPHWWCPQLPASPQAAMALIREGIAAWPHARMAVIGSSLGGFYASVLSRQIGCTAVLLNPAVYPARDLAASIGEHPAWHDPAERVHFDAAYIGQLQDLQTQPATARPPTLAVIAKGDEVLDWREMLTACAHARVRLIEGGDHAISDFDSHIPAILGFLGLD